MVSHAVPPLPPSAAYRLASIVRDIASRKASNCPKVTIEGNASGPPMFHARETYQTCNLDATVVDCTLIPSYPPATPPPSTARNAP